MASPTKTCDICGKRFPRDGEHFHRNRRTQDGFMKTCKLCRKVSRKARYQKNQHKERQAHAIRYAQKKDQGLCVTCGKPALNGGVFCEYHWTARVARLYLDGSYTKALIKKAAAQKYLCPYTGERLFPGVNMSLDHRYPVSRFPEKAKTLANLQWVSSVANAAKADLTEEEFFNLCETVVSYRLKGVTHNETRLHLPSLHE